MLKTSNTTSGRT